MSLQTEEQLVNAGIVGQFGVERRSENLALTQTDHIAVDRRFDPWPARRPRQRQVQLCHAGWQGQRRGGVR